MNGNVLEKGIDNLTDYKRLAEIPHKLGIVATDINSGQEVIFTNVTHHEKLDESKIRSKNYTIFPNSYERLAHVVHASCSFPGIFIPTNVSGLNLVDGGICDNLPVDLIYAMGAKKVISIDLGYSGRSQTRGLCDILSMSLHVLARRNVEDNRGEYGLLLDPHIYDINFLDASKIDEVYDRGIKYANKVLNKITSYIAS